MEYIKWLYDNYFPKMNTELIYLAFLIAIVTGVAGYVILRRRAGKAAWIKAIVCALLSVYYYLVLLSTVYTREYRGPKSNLELFWIYKAVWNGDTVNRRYLILNIWMFMPIGFAIGIILYRIVKRGWLVVLLTSILASFAIEMQQLFFGRGLCEYDDVINNTLGALFGYMLFWFGSRSFVFVKSCLFLQKK